MSLTINHDDAMEGSNILPEGEYEVFIKYICEDVTKSGTIHIAATLIIRNDVEQGYKNKYIWYNLWKRKNPSATDAACNDYGARDIQTLSKSAGLTNGKKYEGLDDWFEDLKGKVIRVTIKHEEFNGQQQAKVNYVNPSRYPENKHLFKSNNPASPDRVAETNADGFVEIDDSDDDLPF